jgi:hypothetical protein
MDDMTFDRWVKSLGAGASRRAAIGLAAGGVSSGLAGLLGWDHAGARNNKKNGKKKSKKKGTAKKKRNKKKQVPQGEVCGSEICKPGQRCCGGACVDPNQCCASNSDCNGCSVCNVGLCVPDLTKNGQKCSGCLECVNGACGVPNDEFCDSDQLCRSSTGLCCPKCLDDRCCPAGSACINPGILSPNACCDESANVPCGNNGDGTFRECCSKFNERCVAGECVPKDEGGEDECPNGQPMCGDECCNAGEECCSDVCLGQGTAICTMDGWCPWDVGHACCGTAGCADGLCCRFSAGEGCCLSMNSNGVVDSHCCPGGSGQCAPTGGCCPANTTWGDCEACCPDGSIGCEGCVAPVAGRG